MFTLKYILTAMVVSGVALVAIAHPRPVRSVAVDNPCNLVLTDDPVKPSDYSIRLADIQTRSEGIELDAQGIKTQLKESGKVHLATATFLNRINFRDTERLTVSQDKISAAVNNQVKALRSHYKILFEYIIRIHDIRGDDTFHTNMDDASVELQNSLGRLQKKLQRTACSFVLALRAKGGYMPEYEQTLLDGYTSFVLPHAYKAYILANDSVKLGSFLQQMYGELAKSNSV